ncbi:MAG TPA: FtsQ-type POTRA domain-containing protein, partial [Acidimicrobiia bacterium]|nr:FtsQ-type POTRA domain-containing protein [Acidimicrobiia bacterium]
MTLPTQHRTDEHRTHEPGVTDVRSHPDSYEDQVSDDHVDQADDERPDGEEHFSEDVVVDGIQVQVIDSDVNDRDAIQVQVLDGDVNDRDVIEDLVPDDRVLDDRVRERPMIDPRIRERRIEVLRAAGRRRLRVTLVIASVIVIAGLGYLAARSPLLAVDHIRVIGSQREPISKIMSAAAVRDGQPMLFIDTGAAARRIERLRWVAHARVHRAFPNTVNIEVTEYVPTAYVQMSGGKIALIASNGHVIALSRTVPPHAIAVLGVHAAPVVGSSLASPGSADVVSQLPPHLRTRVFAIDVGGSNAVIDLRSAAPAGTVCRAAPGSVGGFEQIRVGTLDSLRDKGVAALAVLNHLAG